jgi:hypothetical protein
MSCFTLGTMKGLTFMQYSEYKSAVATYLKVEAYNSNVSTMRGNGDLSLTYYDFVSCLEQTKYKLGLYVLTQNNPRITFTPVQKN